MYGGGMGGPGMLGPGAGPQGPPAPPSGWQAMLRALSAGMEFFGRVTMLMDENVHAVNILISGVLMLFDRGGSLYAEVARFVLRLLGVRIPPRHRAPPRRPGRRAPRRAWPPPPPTSTPSGSPTAGRARRASGFPGGEGRARPGGAGRGAPPLDPEPR